MAMWGGAQGVCAPSGHVTSQHLHAFTNPIALRTPLVRIFLWRLHYISTRLIKSLAINSTATTLPSLEVARGGWKLHSSNHMVGSPGNQPPSGSGISRSPSHQSSHQHTKNIYHFWIFQGFKKLWKEMGPETKSVFLIRPYLSTPQL